MGRKLKKRKKNLREVMVGSAIDVQGRCCCSCCYGDNKPLFGAALVVSINRDHTEVKDEEGLRPNITYFLIPKVRIRPILGEALLPSLTDREQQWCVVAGEGGACSTARLLPHSSRSALNKGGLSHAGIMQ